MVARWYAVTDATSGFTNLLWTRDGMKLQFCGECSKMQSFTAIIGIYLANIIKINDVMRLILLLIVHVLSKLIIILN